MLDYIKTRWKELTPTYRRLVLSEVVLWFTVAVGVFFTWWILILPFVFYGITIPMYK